VASGIKVARPDRALVWNVGTCRPDTKGEIQVEETTRMRVPMRGTGAEQSVVGKKVSVMELDEGTALSGYIASQPEMGGA